MDIIKQAKMALGIGLITQEVLPLFLLSIGFAGIGIIGPGLGLITMGTGLLLTPFGVVGGIILWIIAGYATYVMLGWVDEGLYDALKWKTNLKNTFYEIFKWLYGGFKTFISLVLSVIPLGVGLFTSLMSVASMGAIKEPKTRTTIHIKHR